MSASAIEWTDEVWNPVTGCDRVSPGCAHCYALELAPRLRAMGNAKYQRARDGARRSSGPAFGVTLHPDVLRQPFRWRKPRRVFVNSMSDLFHDEVPDEFIAEVWGVMAANPQHTFQILTKRPERARELLTDDNGWVCRALDEASQWVKRMDAPLGEPGNYCWPAEDYHEFPALRNVWLGVSIENRRYVHRADVLRDTPAAVRFISAEPLLGPLVYDRVDAEDEVNPEWDWADDFDGPDLDLTAIDWLIVGGESGARRRPMRPEWVCDLRDVAAVSDTAFFFKQWGGRTPKAGGRELDGRTWDQMPTAGVCA